MKRLAHIAFVLAMALLVSCSEKFEPRPFTYTQLLTGKTKKTWRAAGLQIRENGQTVAEFILPQNDCIFDDLYIFYANPEKQFQVDDGSLKCSPDDPQIFIESTWSLVNANATLEMVIPFLAPFPLPFVLRELEEDEFTVEIWLDVENTESYRIIFLEVDTE